LQGAVGIDQLWRDDARLGVGFGHLDQPADGIRRHHRIRVEHHQILSARARQRLIRGRRKATVLGVQQRDDLGELLGQHPHRVIAGGVVHHDDLCGHGVLLRAQGLKARAQVLSHVPTDDADTDLWPMIADHRISLCSGTANGDHCLARQVTNNAGCCRR